MRLNEIGKKDRFTAIQIEFGFLYAFTYLYVYCQLFVGLS